MKTNIFMTIRNAKIEAIKKAFRDTFDESDAYRKISDILTPDELVMMFDYLAIATNFDDDEDMDCHFLQSFGEVCVEREYALSPESRLRIVKEVDEDYFTPALS